MTLDTGMVKEALELRRLVKGADSIELKLTLPEQSYRSAAAALGIDPLDAQIRQVFFFDTPDLDLNKAGVVARARRVQGRGDDSVVKLRPVVPTDLPASLRSLPEFVVEVDALPGGYVCSASLKGVPRVSVRETVSGKRTVAQGVLQEPAVLLRRARAGRSEHRRARRAGTDLRAQAQAVAEGVRTQTRRRDVALPGRLPDRRVVDEVPARGGFRRRRATARLPRLEGHPHRWPAGDEDQDRARVLLVRAARQGADQCHRRPRHAGRRDRKPPPPTGDMSAGSYSPV